MPVSTSQWLDVKYKEIHQEPLNRPTTAGQDDFLKKEEEGTITKVAGKTWKCDPELVVARIFNKIFKRG